MVSTFDIKTRCHWLKDTQFGSKDQMFSRFPYTKSTFRIKKRIA